MRPWLGTPVSLVGYVCQVPVSKSWSLQALVERR